MFSLEDSPVGEWRPEELAAVFQHQWSAPVLLDLGRLSVARSSKLVSVSAAQGLLLKSYRDLFFHPCPPVELLVLAKDFAKAHEQGPDSPLPREIALALYYTSIFTAWVRLGDRISALGDRALADAAAWIIAQTWVDEPTKELFRAGIGRLTGNNAKGGTVTP
jgi:hypothetical protein